METLSTSSIVLPAPILEPVIGYGTIFTGIVALIGMVGMFYGMKYKLDDVVEWMKKVDIKLDEMRAIDKQVALNLGKISDHERRIIEIEHTLYLRDMGIKFGQTLANKSSMFQIEDKANNT